MGIVAIFKKCSNNLSELEKQQQQKASLMISPCWKCYSFMKSFSFHQPIHRIGGIKMLVFDAK